MSFLQLVFSLDKTFEGNNSILENMSILTDIATHVNSNKKFALNQEWVILATNNFTIVQYKDIAIFHPEYVNRSLEDKILHL